MKNILILLVLILTVTFVFSKEEVRVSNFDFNVEFSKKNIDSSLQKKLSITAITVYENDKDRLNRIEEESNNVDVVYFTDYYSLLAKKEGLLLDLDTSKLINLENIFSVAKDPIKENYAVGYTVYSLGIVYRVDKIRRPLVSWKDLWREDILEFLALPNLNNPEGPAFYKMIDEVFGGEDDSWDLKIAFEKIEEIKDEIYSFYSSSNELKNLFEMKKFTLQ